MPDVRHACCKCIPGLVLHWRHFSHRTRIRFRAIPLYYRRLQLFTKLIDSYAAYKFVSGTEYCQAYAQLGSAERDYRQTPPCARE